MQKLTAQQIQKLKEVELDILKAFVDVCEKLHLRYYLLGGTLLGAVRHRGFIPWDDDIDVGMPREDYERFIKEGQALFPPHLFIQDVSTDPEWCFNFVKIRNSDTAFVELSTKNMNINHGVFLDVFPLDFYPKGKLRGAFLNFKKDIMWCRICDRLYLPDSKTAFIKLLIFLSKIIYPSFKKTVIKRDRLFRSVESSDRVANFSGAWGKKEIVPKEWYGDGVLLEFEGLSVRAPSEYDKWLTQVYGDYMTLPPEEKRIGHHYTETVDFEKPYTEYLKNRGENK